MARDFLSIPTSLGNEPDFCALTAEEQHAYLLVCLRPEHRWLGVLPLTPNRWARAARELTPEGILSTVRALALSNWVALDESTDELFVPRFMAYNTIDRQPSLLAVAIREAGEIWSPRIRIAAAEVFDAIPRDIAARAARDLRTGTRITETRRSRAVRPAIPARVRHAVYERDWWRCAYCGLTFKPTARQAADVRAAAIAACGLCDDHGYAGARVCDHDPTTPLRAARGSAQVRAALADRRTPSDTPADPEESRDA